MRFVLSGESSLTAWVLLWVAAVSSLATFLITLRRDRQAARKAQAEEEGAWSLHWADYLDDPPFRCLRLRLHDIDTQKCRLKSVTVTKPGGARIAPQTFTADGGGQRHATAERSQIGRRIVLDKVLDGASARSAGPQYDDAFFYVVIPRKPRFGLAAKASVHVTCRVAEISRRSRRRKIALISPPVDWAPDDAASPDDLKAAVRVKA